jgi:3-phenylpropionate/cinnamic acid dioxygenase small subunit
MTVTDTALTAIAHQGVTDTVVRANLALDQADIDAWVGCFTTHARLTITDNGGRVLHHLQGETQLHHYATQAARSSYAAGAVRHWNANLVIDSDTDSASVDSYLLIATTGHNQTVVATGTVHDELRYHGARWVIAAREVRLDGIAHITGEASQ